MTIVLNWLKGRGPATPAEPAGRMDARYSALHTYLEHRYANTVFLTFGQIEDLLGFPLPDRARADLDWWTAPGTAELGHSYAWTQAAMTAKPNCAARNVLFERALPPR